jgi:hypothetical protein
MPRNQEHLRLAGVTRLGLSGRGPQDAYVFDPHRLALPCWALALRDRPKPALLLTLDRHLDLAPPPADPLPNVADLTQVDRYTRETLDVRNVNHILAAMDLGLIGDAIAIARASPAGATTDRPWIDRHGQPHHILTGPTLERFTDGFGTNAASPLAREAQQLLEEAPTVVLDLDLDCFTTPSDADPTSLLSWPPELIREFLLPAGSELFWDAVLKRCAVFTLAREPYHCGGLIAAGRLFESAAPIVFQELLRTDPPT